MRRMCFLVLGLLLCLAALPAAADDPKKPPAAPPAGRNDDPKLEGKSVDELVTFVKQQGARARTKEDFELALKAVSLIEANAAATPEQKKEAVNLKTRCLFMGATQHKDAFRAAFEAHVAGVVKKTPGSDEAALAQGFGWMNKNMKPNRSFDPAGEAELLEIAKTHPTRPIIGQLVGMYANGIGSDAEAVAFLKKAVAAMKDGAGAEPLKPLLANKSILGNPIEIAGPTLEGKKFNIADLKGKVVLVDFWATWCGPCCAEIPNVKKVFEKHKDKGFVVVAVSLDHGREELEKYVKENNLPWTQVFFENQAERGGNPLADKYGINAIPATFLVGKDGKVIARDLRGEEKLEKAVAEALAK